MAIRCDSDAETADRPTSVSGIRLPTRRSWTAVREAIALRPARLARNSRLTPVARTTKTDAARRSDAVAMVATLRLPRFPMTLVLSVSGIPVSAPLSSRHDRKAGSGERNASSLADRSPMSFHG